MSYLFWTSIIDISLPKNKLNHKTVMYLFIFTDYMFASNKQYLKYTKLLYNFCG